MVVEVIKTSTSKEDNQGNKISVAEDVVKEVVEQTTQTLNVTNVTNMGTLRRTVIPIVVEIVERWDILQNIVVLKERWKRQQTLP